jgi:hypothetical protein
MYVSSTADVLDQTIACSLGGGILPRSIASCESAATV